MGARLSVKAGITNRYYTTIGYCSVFLRQLREIARGQLRDTVLHVDKKWNQTFVTQSYSGQKGGCLQSLSKTHSPRSRIWFESPLQWPHNERDGVSNHRRLDCLLKRLLRHRSKKIKLRVTGHCVGNSTVTGEFPAQRSSNAENVSIWWRHHINSWSNSQIYCLWRFKGTRYMWTDQCWFLECKPRVWSATDVSWSYENE